MIDAQIYKIKYRYQKDVTTTAVVMIKPEPSDTEIVLQQLAKKALVESATTSKYPNAAEDFEIYEVENITEITSDVVMNGMCWVYNPGLDVIRNY